MVRENIVDLRCYAYGMLVMHNKEISIKVGMHLNLVVILILFTCPWAVLMATHVCGGWGGGEGGSNYQNINCLSKLCLV